MNNKATESPLAPVIYPTVEQDGNQWLKSWQFKEPPVVAAAPWADMAQGQYVWLDISGRRADGSSHTWALIDGEQISAREVDQEGLARTLSRRELAKFQLNGKVTLLFRLNRDSDDKEQAEQFPQSDYWLQQGDPNVVFP